MIVRVELSTMPVFFVLDTVVIVVALWLECLWSVLCGLNAREWSVRSHEDWVWYVCDVLYAVV